jgi:hypothetical protein
VLRKWQDLVAKNLGYQRIVHANQHFVHWLKSLRVINSNQQSLNSLNTRSKESVLISMKANLFQTSVIVSPLATAASPPSTNSMGLFPAAL